MEVVWAAQCLIVPISLLIWKHGITGDARSVLQGLVVLYASVVVSGLYFALKARTGHDPTAGAHK